MPLPLEKRPFYSCSTSKKLRFSHTIFLALYSEKATAPASHALTCQPESGHDLHPLCAAQDGQRAEKSAGYLKTSFYNQTHSPEAVVCGIGPVVPTAGNSILAQLVTKLTSALNKMYVLPSHHRCYSSLTNIQFGGAMTRFSTTTVPLLISSEPYRVVEPTIVPDVES